MLNSPQKTYWSAPIARWSILQGFNSEHPPDISFVEPALRRRLDSLGKMIFKVAHECASDISSTRLVYASRHGNLSRTTAMLIDLASRQAISPTAFSMSVPNATTGIYSIFKRDRSPSTTISATESSFGFGLLEACVQLASNPDTPVLFVYADEPIPAIYGTASETFTPHAVGLLLSNDAKSEITCQMEYSKHSSSTIPQSQAFLQCLAEANDAIWHGDGRKWLWRWHDRKD